MSSPHILIAGGGMVGLSLALMLDAALPENVRISVVEGTAHPPADSDAYHPSFDARSTALSFSSARIYRNLGLWPRLEAGLGPIRDIHVSRRGRFGSSVLSASEQNWAALGWVVENPCLGRGLLAMLRERPRIQLRCPAQVLGAELQAEQVRVTLDSGVESADLLVIADGADSTLRESLGFFTQRKQYEQHAVISNLAFSKPHQGRAFERFTDDGPLALLPLVPTIEHPHRMALVWSLAPSEAQQLCDADDRSFSTALVDAFGYRLGKPSRVGQRFSYPLALTETIEQVRRGCVVIGNAAHALHPVAGQGFNLALRDAQALVRTLSSAYASGDNLGDPNVLGRYLDSQRGDQLQTIAASDGLPALFMATDPLLSIGRDLALAGMDVFPALRQVFVREAAGMAALEAHRG